MPRVTLKARTPDEPVRLSLAGEFVGSAFSPTIEVEETEAGYEVTTVHMTPEGPFEQTFELHHGISPRVDVSETASAHLVTVTDARGEHQMAVPTYAAEEAARSRAEKSRQWAEDARNGAEAARERNDASRGASEAQRAQSEDGRASAEGARASAEVGREAAESSRAQSERAREASESSRAEAEEARAGAEEGRRAAEAARAAAESSRAEAARRAVVSATATVDGEIGQPTVTVELGAPADGGRAVSFAFSGLKGEHGDASAPGGVGTLQLADGAVTLEKMAGFAALNAADIDSMF